MLFINMFNFIKIHFPEIIVISLLVIFTPIFIYLIFGAKNTPPVIPAINPNPTPITSPLDQNYNNFNLLIPGKSTLSDVEKVNGPAYKDVVNGGKTYLYYKTPSSDYENQILLENGILIYSLEYVFGNYRGTYSDYVNTYGRPTLYLYNKDSADSEWFIFLERGFGLEVGGNDILQIIHFTPQPQGDFMKNIFPDLNLSLTPPSGVHEHLPDVTPAP